MQGINKTRHAHLVDALLQIERQLSTGSEYLQEAEEYRAELESMYNDYEHMLGELAGHIRAYETLFGQVKVQFLGKKLKVLKKDMMVERTNFPIGCKNAPLVYEP